MADVAALPPQLMAEMATPVFAYGNTLTPCMKALKSLRAGDDATYMAMREYCSAIQSVGASCMHFPRAEFMHTEPCSAWQRSNGLCQWERSPGVWCRDGMGRYVIAWRPKAEGRSGKQATALPTRRR